ncbi:hypothetical protein KKQ42_06065, partial [Enterobacter hormaechei subsp. xiangfangensis]|nr:hypothetical protein [Enterobacter hormaechei subsp. xiangfangensis]
MSDLYTEIDDPDFIQVIAEQFYLYIQTTDDDVVVREGANKRGNSSRLTQSFHFFMFEPIFSPVNAL